MKTNQFIILFCMFGITNFGTASNNAIENDMISYYSRLKTIILSNKSLELEEFARRDIYMSNRLSIEICNFLEKTTTITSQKCRALYILGLLGNSNSIPVIIKNMDLYNPAWSGPNKEVPLIAASPAQQALVTIGMRSVPYIIKEFLVSQNTTKRYLCLDSIFKIYLKGFSREEALDVVQFTVKNKIKKSSLPNKQLLLEELNKWLSKRTCD